MAIRNEISVYIDGLNRTYQTVMPIKFGNFLDERLDECNLSLRGVKKEFFSPLTPVEIHVESIEYFGDWNNNPTLTGNVHGDVFYFVIGNDNANEVRPGSGIYNHELYCLEVTKVAECIAVDALTYTNDIGRNYTSNAAFAEPVWG